MLTFCSFFEWHISVQPFGSLPTLPMPLWHWKHVRWYATLSPGMPGISGLKVLWQFLHAIKPFTTEFWNVEGATEWQSLQGSVPLLPCWWWHMPQLPAMDICFEWLNFTGSYLSDMLSSLKKRFEFVISA